MKRLVVLVAACGGPAAAPEVANTVDRTGADLTPADYFAAAVKLDKIACPAGTTQVGDDPPDDDYAYCVLPDGTRHGPWMTWPSVGNPRKIGIEDHGDIVHWTSWHLGNDTLAVVMDDANGRLLRWHDNGQLAYDGHYTADDVPDGHCQAWDRDGASIFDAKLRDGTGRLVTWNDELRVEETWAGGKLDGPRTQWYPNGQVESIIVYDGGAPGDREVWHPNGVKARNGSVEWDEHGNELPEMCAHGPCDEPY